MSVIAAISTPVGTGGLAVIRVSGDGAVGLCDRLFHPLSGKTLAELSGYRAAYGRVVYRENVLDDGVALVFRAPKSYTGEETVELMLHGGRLIAEQVLEALIAEGARLAAPGEFTKRAFLNGKMDLAEAESVMGLIAAENETAGRIARGCADGRLSREIEAVTDILLELSACYATWADYPDEDLPELAPENFDRLLSLALSRTEALLSTYRAGRVIREGIDCTIAGKPNVGKSTLMNLLAGCEKSIVTDVAGTTRDVVEETVRLGNTVLHLADTAGIRETPDRVEQVGVERARKRVSDAALVLAVFDASSPLDAEDRALLAELDPRRTLIILNKTDLESAVGPEAFEGFEQVSCAAGKGQGLSQIEKAVEKLTDTAGFDSSAAVLISERQYQCVRKAYDSLTRAQSETAAGQSPDLINVLVEDAVGALLELTGKRVTDAVADEVFSRFCVGK